MTYTSHGLMTAADLDEYRKDYDMNPEPIELRDLARELNTEPWKIIDFDATLPPYTGDDMLISADDADAIREAWDSASTNDVSDPGYQCRDARLGKYPCCRDCW